MTQSDAPNEGREEKAHGYTHGPKVPTIPIGTEANTDDVIASLRRKLTESNRQLLNLKNEYQTLYNNYGNHDRRINELLDQLSKERREKEKLKELHIHQETHLNDQFEKERKMRKELVDGYVSLLDSEEFQHHFSTTTKEIKSLISRASELDKESMMRKSEGGGTVDANFL